GTALVTQALVHLLDVADGLFLLTLARTAHVDRPELLQRHPRPIVVEPPAAPQDAGGALEVALLAHRLAQGWIEPFRMDDVVFCGGADVPLARAMTALAADGVPAEDRLAIAVARVLDRLDAIGVTVQASPLDEPARPCPRREARRQVPELFLREPADRRLEDEAVVRGQVRMAAHPRTDDVI